MLLLPFWTFWNQIDVLGTDTWDKCSQECVVRWKKGYEYVNGDHQHVRIGTTLVKDTVSCWKGNDRLFYHYSWVRPLEKIRQKLVYYEQQTGVKTEGYLENIFLKWRKTPQNFNGPTHPCTGGRYSTHHGLHPFMIQHMIDSGELNF